MSKYVSKKPGNKKKIVEKYMFSSGSGDEDDDVEILSKTDNRSLDNNLERNNFLNAFLDRDASRIDKKEGRYCVGV